MHAAMQHGQGLPKSKRYSQEFMILNLVLMFGEVKETGSSILIKIDGWHIKIFRILKSQNSDMMFINLACTIRGPRMSRQFVAHAFLIVTESQQKGEGECECNCNCNFDLQTSFMASLWEAALGCSKDILKSSKSFHARPCQMHEVWGTETKRNETFARKL